MASNRPDADCEGSENLKKMKHFLRRQVKNRDVELFADRVQGLRLAPEADWKSTEGCSKLCAFNHRQAMPFVERCVLLAGVCAVSCKGKTSTIRSTPLRLEAQTEGDSSLQMCLSAPRKRKDGQPHKRREQVMKMVR